MNNMNKKPRNVIILSFTLAILVKKDSMKKRRL